MSFQFAGKSFFNRLIFDKFAGLNDLIQGTEQAGSSHERAKLIADILFGVFGEDVDTLLSDEEVDDFAKVWDESKYTRHPRGARFGGRFAPKNSAEAVTAVHGAINEALSGARTEESASEIVDLLSNLTINQLRDIKLKYKISASGRLKTDLVAKIAARLDSGRRMPVSQPEPVAQVPLNPGVSATAEENNVIGGWLEYIDRHLAEGASYSAVIQLQHDSLNKILQGQDFSAQERDAAVEWLNKFYENYRGQFGVGTWDRDRKYNAAASLLTKLGVDAEALFMAKNPNSRPPSVTPQRVSREWMPRNSIVPPPTAPEPIARKPIAPSPMRHEFTSVSSGKDRTDMVQSTLALPQISGREIELLLDIVPGTEYENMVDLISTVRPEFTDVARSSVDRRNAEAAEVGRQMAARQQPEGQTQMSAREKRMARARAEVEASRSARQTVETSSAALNSRTADPGPRPIPTSTEYTRDQIERRLLLERARRALDSGNGMITQDRYDRLLAEHEALAAPAGWDRPQASMIRSAGSEFVNRMAMFMKFDESKITRRGKGDDRGGEFAPKAGSGERPPMQPIRVSDALQTKLPNDPINAVIKKLKSDDVYEILRQHKTMGEEHTRKMDEQYAELAELVQDDESGGEGINDKKKAEILDKAELWKMLRNSGMDGIDGDIPAPEPIAESLTLNDVLTKRESNANVINQGTDGSSIQSWDDIDSDEQRDIGRQWQIEMLQNDDMQREMWKAANDSIDDSELLEENIADLIAENSDALDSVREDYSSVIHEAEKKIGMTYAPDYEAMQNAQKELVDSLTTDAETDDSWNYELMKQRVILDTMKRLNFEEHEFKTQKEQIQEAFENSESWIMEAIDARRQFKIDEMIGDDWGKKYVEERWEEFDTDDAITYAYKKNLIKKSDNNKYKNMSDEDFASLGWGPEGTDVIVSGDGTEVEIKVKGDGLQMSRTINGDENYIYNNSFFLNDDSPYKGQGGKILAQQVMHAMAAGYDKIVTDPGRSSGMNGYYSWFTLGYDIEVSELSSRMQDSISDAYPDAGSVQDIFEKPGGRDWWLVNGEYVHGAEFDLTPGSRSLRVLRDSMAAKKKK